MKIQIEITEEDTGAKLFARLSPEIKKMFGESRMGKFELTLQKPKRTLRQNNSLWLFLAWLASALNDSDNLLTLKYFEKEFEIQWTTELAKDRIFNPIMKATTGKESSTKLTTAELTKVCGTIRENLAKKLNIVLNFPNELDRQLGIKPYEV